MSLPIQEAPRDGTLFLLHDAKQSRYAFFEGDVLVSFDDEGDTPNRGFWETHNLDGLTFSQAYPTRKVVRA